MKKSRYTAEQIAFALRQAESGTPVIEVCRKMGICEQSFYRWINGLIEAFNGRLHQECLNESWFLSPEDAREKVGDWRQQYTKDQPHGALGNMSPLEYAMVNGKIR